MKNAKMHLKGKWNDSLHISEDVSMDLVSDPEDEPGFWWSFSDFGQQLESKTYNSVIEAVQAMSRNGVEWTTNRVRE
jgi:hypothetical protein